MRSPYLGRILIGVTKDKRPVIKGVPAGRLNGLGRNEIYCCTPTAGFSAGVPLAVVARAAKKLWS
jgi:hypothetical protein